MPKMSTDTQNAETSLMSLATSVAANTRTLKTEDVSNALIRKLQTTLDTKDLIRWFVDGVIPLLGEIRAIFTSELVSVAVGPSRKTHHSVNYNLTLEGKSLGQIEFRRSVKFAESELSALESLLSCLVFPLRNSLQYQEAINAALSDALTGVGNKRSFDYQLHREVAQGRRYGSVLALIVFDIDHFKNINDTYGHNAGDAVLKQLTTVVEDNCRDTDMIFRMGGEEFSLLLSKTDIDGALVIAERVRQAIASTTFCYDSQKISVTVSLGVACHEGNESRGSLLERADQALYSAKRQGRNQAILAKQHYVPVAESHGLGQVTPISS